MSEENFPEVNGTPDVEETPKTFKEKIEDFKNQVAEAVVEVKENLEETIGDVAVTAAQIKDKIADKIDVIEDKFEDVSDKLEDKFEDLGDKIEDTIDRIKGKEADEAPVDLAALSLSELSDMFDKLSQSEDRMKRYKEAEAIKSAFYKKLSKEKAQAGLGSAVDEPSSREDVIEEVVETAAPVVADNPFEAMETAFKGVYANYKKERAEYNRQQDEKREENFALKQAVIEDLKTLVEKQEDVNSTFPAFRELQNRWREIGPVPAAKFRDVNDTYQFYVEKFYDMVKINRELRDLDFKKNLEAKEEFCKAAEKLSENDNPVEAFRELQKLHEQWKEFGPVAKEYRDAIWDRFKAATATINKKYQAFFEGQKEKQKENLDEKTKLCEQIEEIADREVKSSNEWNTLSAQIEEIQKKWRTIGFATKKDNQKIYDRFRAACDKFFNRKREYYSQFKDSMNENMEKKLSLIEKAEALKDSKEWKKTSEAFIALQQQWKEIGAVPRKKSEQLWKRFRAACDAFFNERDAQAKPENDYYGNLKAKRALVEEIKAFTLSEDSAENMAAAKEFASKWQAIGFVPFKEKENIQNAYSEAMKEKFPDFSPRGQRNGGAKNGGGQRKPLSEKDRLVQQYSKLQQDIVTYENNIGFFSASKNSEPLIKQMRERIDAAKQELKDLEEKIRQIEESEEEK